jgi:hypothetical protein
MSNKRIYLLSVFGIFTFKCGIGNSDSTSSPIPSVARIYFSTNFKLFTELHKQPYFV